MFFSKKFLMVAVVAAAVSVGMSASSRADFIGNGVTLASLLDGGTLVVGDKTFSNFTYSHTGDMPDATAVNVIGGSDAAGNLGIRFQGGFMDNAGTPNSSDALIGYTVTVTDPTRYITDAHLYSNPSVLGQTVSASIAESFSGFPTNTLSAGIVKVGGTIIVNNPDDVTFFTGKVTSLTVLKDINANGGTTDTGGQASFSQIDQTFSQNTPEPSSVLLLASGSVIIGLVARRRKFTAKA
jgi:hypothetical protein